MLAQLLDRWTLVHFSFWFAMGAALILFKMPLYLRWIIIITSVVGWELVEHWLEHDAGFLDEAEPWLNRWVSDPIVSFIAAICGAWWVSK